MDITHIIVLSVFIALVLSALKLLYKVSHLRLDSPTIKLAEYVRGHMTARSR